MRDVLERQLQHLLARVAHDLAESPVDAEEFARGGNMGDAGGGLLERDPEPFLARPQVFLDAFRFSALANTCATSPNRVASVSVQILSSRTAGKASRPKTGPFPTNRGRDAVDLVANARWVSRSRLASGGKSAILETMTGSRAMPPASSRGRSGGPTCPRGGKGTPGENANALGTGLKDFPPEPARGRSDRRRGARRRAAGRLEGRYQWLVGRSMKRAEISDNNASSLSRSSRLCSDVAV